MRKFRKPSFFTSTVDAICATCTEKICERYLLQVNGLQYHSNCLRCNICARNLQSDSSCFFREGQVYCKNDYYRTFGTKCAKCTRWINSSDWIRRARDSHSMCEQVYHLACFACDACKRQLSTGEEFALLDERVLCKTHYQQTVEGPSTDSDESGQDGDHVRSKSKTKRVRTTFTEEQLQVLQANFQLDSNPDGQDFERIAQITGLSKRVTQVWFQNSRARQKKHNNNHKRSANQPFRRQINLRLTSNFAGDSSLLEMETASFS
ncbi:unnamed protein product [Allacma fusca]|uniref:LIM/homeobox protein Awh n=1 Tax=Allacma fusca TaxID=39272 RepID=A0A8J2P568_9HEXA|nr:unnamed protein product [Allacma fusca]